MKLLRTSLTSAAAAALATSFAASAAEPPAAASPPAVGAPAAGAEAAPAKEAARAEDTVKKAFEAALAGRFSAYLDLIAPEERETDVQRKDLERHAWARFRKQAKRYLQGDDAGTFAVARRDAKDGGEVRLYLTDRTDADRMPVPITLVERGGRWWILRSSL